MTADEEPKVGSKRSREESGDDDVEKKVAKEEETKVDKPLCSLSFKTNWSTQLYTNLGSAELFPDFEVQKLTRAPFE